MPRSRSKPAREPLSTDRIERAALDLIERDGLDGFSTRKLAADLGCEAMSIYHYFPSKAHLMDALVDRFLVEVGVPSPALAPLERMRRLAMDYRAVALRHPRFYEIIATHRLNTPAGIRWIAGVLEIWAGLGLDLETRARLFRVFGYYVNGAALDETRGYSKGYSAAEPVADDVIRRDYPEVEAVNPFFKARHHQATFDLGLDMLLDGIARKLEAAGLPAASVGPRRAARTSRS